MMMIIKITGMTCGHCVKVVETTLAKVPGVEEVKEISLKDGTAQIEGKPDPQELIAALMGEGYTAKIT